MRFASCRAGDRRFAALVEDGRARPLEGVRELGTGTPAELLADPPLAASGDLALEEVELLPVVPRPGKVICLGLNYRAHVDETGRELPTYPVLFAKFASSLIGARAPIAVPPESQQVDYEAEMAVVIGRPVRRATREQALEAVAGYTVANDVTMRDYQYRTHQWLQGKAWDGATPLGPYLVTPDEVGDPGALDITLRLNGEVMQHANTELLIFDVAEVVCRVSEFTRLEPGDVLLTGTPAGVGFRRDPQVLLTPGDRVEVEIDRVGVLANPVVAEER